MAICPWRHREIRENRQVLDRLPNNYEKRRFIMAKQNVLYTKEDSIGIITLNRAEKLNALTHKMLRRINSIIEDVKKDDMVRAVILTGNGRAFSAGTDISGEVPQTAEVEINLIKEKTSTEYRQSLWFFNSIPKPVICAINGAAVGIAAEFSLHCDIRIAAESARWGQVFVLRGMTPDTGAGTYLLPRIVGLSKACELVFSGDIIDAQEMLRIGLVSKVVPDAELMPTAREMAKKLTRGAPLAVQMAKQLMYRGLEQTMEAHQEAARYCFQLSCKTEDVQEGIVSFFEKRGPHWKGK
jgi:2-(1,2-epoxy-1,2-dihydrophenyl)acetyl-CoA isomerase